jgi:hypothetical protein
MKDGRVYLEIGTLAIKLYRLSKVNVFFHSANGIQSQRQEIAKACKGQLSS